MRFLFLYLFTLSTSITINIYSQQKKSSNKPNILFIAIDDLRPELKCYGSNIAISPNIDKIANQGLLFKNAYCQQAICGPSRASILTGIRPETSGVFHNYIKFREANPNVVTLPQLFKNNGYETVYTGKIFHHGDLDDDQSWSRLPAIDSMKLKGIKNPVGFALEQNLKERSETRKKMISQYGEVAKYGLASGAAYECADVPDNTYTDGYNTELAIATMKEMLKKNDKPFFLGLGFNKPHLNWVAPKKYWDLYDKSKIELAIDNKSPKDGAEMGLHASFELRVRNGIPKKGTLDNNLERTLKHAYLACVSYVDAQIGKMINALDKAGVRENTIIIIWSDHGYHLGDMGIWGKATNYEIATRVPLIIWTPNMPLSSKGKKTDALIELVDIYPTLAELAKLPIPKVVEGTSFVPLINNLNTPWKTAAFSQFPTPALREWGAYPLRPAMRETYFGPLIKEVEGRIKKQQKNNWNRSLFENTLMGYAMRTKQYRFVVWKDRANPQKQPIYFELYDHNKDPLETKNIAKSHPKLVKKLLIQFNKGWKGNTPTI
ncbi:iduronate-2-sulfatase [Wenyingzhuangia fucanilytica]|uniref:Iduronate-2-sulfatase n=1 Tax=Wenyingzhuangia fucanilytica TaxID=1790137 RepID=A0A1B1Y7B5_9FLAO|nr:sulfatase [Wenyingzhuangia fucanilytica]ANW96624.1 iduronate-2-sulfatase [Wenyingzhuangia fucanilytica]